MAGFYNSASNSVSRNLAHHLLVTPRSSTASNGTPVIIRPASPDAPSPSAAVISFGGSGHEPFAAGFLGEGLLCAAVPGALFASPPAAHVAEAFVTAAAAFPSVSAIIAIVLNYQGDRLSFQRAAERYARLEANPLPVFEVVVEDDISIPNAVRPRGLAGAALVAKVVGAASAAGVAVADVLDIGKSAAAGVVTIGAALAPAHLPGDSAATGIGNVSIGLGIHNEPGYETLPFGPAAPEHIETFASHIVEILCDKLEAALAERGTATDAPAMVILVNNLGGVSQLSLGVIQHCVMEYVFAPGGTLSQGEGRRRDRLLRCIDEEIRVYLCSGTLVSSLDMPGFSVSIMPLSDKLETFLLSETDAPAWPQVARVSRREYEHALTSMGLARQPSPIDPVEDGPAPRSPGPARITKTTLARSRGHARERQDGSPALNAVEAIAQALLENANELGELDRKVGDGDFGHTLSVGCQAIMKSIDENTLPPKTPSKMCQALADLLGTSVGGTSGGMAVVFLEAFATHYETSAPDTRVDMSLPSPARETEQVQSTTDAAPRRTEAWRDALSAACAAVCAQGGAVVGDRTMVDALQPAAAAAARGASAASIAQAAAAGAASTAKMRIARRGRSASVAPHILEGSPDPGAVAISIAFRAWASSTASKNADDGKDGNL